MQEWINERYGDQDSFDFFAVNINEDRELVADYVEEIGLEVPVILGDGEVDQMYSLRGNISPYPLDFVIDGEGIVRYANHEYEPEVMLMVIDRLLEIGEDDVPEVDPDLQPRGFLLYPAYPNPFNSSTTIRYDLPYPGIVKLQVYNPTGQSLTTLFEGYSQAGEYSTSLTANNLPTGLYFVRLQASDQVFTQKVMLIR